MIGIKILAVAGVDESGLTLAIRQREEKSDWQIFIQINQSPEEIRESLVCLIEQLTTERNKETDAIQQAIEKFQTERRG